MTRNETVETYYRENYAKLVKTARRRVGNYSLPIAEEAVQEAFTRALKYYRSYKSTDSFHHWFNRILRNTINQIKTQEKDGGVTHDSEEDVATTGDIISVKEIISVLQDTSPRDRQILTGYFFDGFKTREIAELTGISHDVVRDRIRYFRGNMKK